MSDDSSLTICEGNITALTIHSNQRDGLKEIERDNKITNPAAQAISHSGFAESGDNSDKNMSYGNTLI